MLSDIKLIKFVNGEFVIGQVMNHKDGVLTIKKPVVPHLEPTQTGQIQLIFMDWPMLGGDDNFTVEVKEENLLINPTNPPEKIRDAYNEKFGSGIVLANKLFRG